MLASTKPLLSWRNLLQIQEIFKREIQNTDSPSKSKLGMHLIQRLKEAKL